MSLGNFQLDIARFVEKAKGNVDQVVRKVSFDMFYRVISKSPVREGRFKGSWIVAINSVPTLDPGTLDKGGGATIARMQAVVATAKAGDVLVMTSSLPYSRRLEFGWSKQAPAGVVRISVSEYPNVVNRAASTVR